MSNEMPIEPMSSAKPAAKRTPLFYVWYDDTPHKQTTDKLDEAINGFIARFTMRPSHVLVNSAELLGRTDLIVGSGPTVQPNTFWLSNENAVATNAV